MSQLGKITDMQTDMQTVTLKIGGCPADVHREAKIRAAQLGISLAQWIIEAMRLALKKKAA